MSCERCGKSISFHYVRQHWLYTLLSAIFLHICSSCRRRPPLTHVKILTESQSIISLHCSAGRPDRPRYLRVHRAKEGRGMGQVLPLLKRELVLPFNTLIQLFAYHHLATLVSWMERGESQLWQTATLLRCGNNLGN